MMDLDIHICVQLLVYFKPTQANKRTKRRRIKKKRSGVNKLNTYASNNTWENYPSPPNKTQCENKWIWKYSQISKAFSINVQKWHLTYSYYKMLIVT